MNAKWIKTAVRVVKLASASVLIAACVTINVYFPAAAAEKAADQIIDSITGAVGAAVPSAPATPPPTTRNEAAQPNLLIAAVGHALYAIVPAAQAQEVANLDISSPEIRAITSSMQARFGQLQKYFESGALGMTNSGLVEVRDASGVALPERAVLTRLVAEDNRDREALYKAIAAANNHPEWFNDIRQTFAKRWVERGARPGWYYQNAGGAWVKK
ncbi:MAG: YdbL family protein [Nevskiaceae bacterium]|jgi:uncharacterized protein YdbL (DUF1318 family)|nr:YdbL family protein [Nevskiaceae bacterium]